MDQAYYSFSIWRNQTISFVYVITKIFLENKKILFLNQIPAKALKNGW